MQLKKNEGPSGRARAIPKEDMDAICKVLNNEISKIPVCLTFEVKHSTLIDPLPEETL